MSAEHGRAEPPEESSGDMTDYERALVAIESKKAANERLKAWLTAGTILVSAFSAVLVYYSAQRTQHEQAAAAFELQHEQATAAFELQVAEMVLGASTSHEAKSRMSAMAVLFPDQWSGEAAQQLNPDEMTWGRTGKQGLLELLAGQEPADRAWALQAYSALFPCDGYAERMAPLVGLAGDALSVCENGQASQGAEGPTSPAPK